MGKEPYEAIGRYVICLFIIISFNNACILMIGEDIRNMIKMGGFRIAEESRRMVTTFSYPYSASLECSGWQSLYTTLIKEYTPIIRHQLH